MSIRRDIPLEEFEIIISPPSNRLASMCVNIYEDGKFNLNGKLAAKIGGKKLGIRLTRDGKYLCLIENGDIAFPKSGSCKIPEVTKKPTAPGSAQTAEQKIRDGLAPVPYTDSVG